MTAPLPNEWRDTVRLDVALLDPRRLAPHPRNVRDDLGDLAGLAESIAAQGVIEPLTVIQLDDGSFQLVAGHRRAAAAIAAGVDQVPCVIRRDLSVDAATDLVQAGHVGTMLAENLQRVGLTVVEEAHGVQTMLDLGLDLSAVATRTGLDRKRVAKAAGVARLAPGAAAAVATAGLTLDQAAVVAAFQGHDGIVERLVVAAGEGPGRFAHAVTRVGQEVAAAQRLDERRAELEAAGHRVIVGGEAPSASFTVLSGLLQDGEVLRAETHANCPGAAVLLQVATWNGDVAEDPVCTDPAGNGHTGRWVNDPSTKAPGASMSDEELERQRAERREVLSNNRAMEAASTTRRAWVREYLARRTAPKEVLRFAVEAFAKYPEELHSWLSGMGTQEGAAAVGELGLVRPARWMPTDVSLTSGEHVVDGRLPLQLLAHVAAAVEAATPRDAWRSTGHERDRLTTWLTFLVGQGYSLADIEQQIVDGAGTAP